MNYIWSLWSGKVDHHNGPFPLQLAEIDELHEALENVIDLYNKREEVKEKLQQINGLREPLWNNASSINSLMENCRVILAQLDYLAINNNLADFQNNLSDFSARSNAHPINGRILEAFRKRDPDTYCRLFEEAVELYKKAKSVNKKRQLIGKLAEAAPDLAGHLACCNDTKLWSDRLNQLDKAWA